MRVKECIICGDEFNPRCGRQMICEKEDCKRLLKCRRNKPSARYSGKKNEDLNRIAVLAKEAGMSYGKYVQLHGEGR